MSIFNKSTELNCIQIMEKFRYSLVIALFLLLVSCTSYQYSYYQIYKTKAENGDINDKWISYFEDNFTIRYNLLSNKGYILFEIYNSSNEDIVIDLDKTFFVLNDEVKEYYQNETTTQTLVYSNSEATITKSFFKNESYLSSEGNSSGSSESISDKQFVTIPPGTFRTFRKFNIIDSYLEQKDLIKYPKPLIKNKVTFTSTNSPIKFANIISYKQGDKSNRITHNFYVDEVANYSGQDVLSEVNVDDYGNITRPYYVLNIESPNMFYYRYYGYK